MIKVGGDMKIPAIGINFCARNGQRKGEMVADDVSGALSTLYTRYKGKIWAGSGFCPGESPWDFAVPPYWRCIAQRFFLPVPEKMEVSHEN